MTTFTVDSDAVANASSGIRGIAEEIRAEVARLMSQIASLQAVWTGPAAMAFDQAAQDWRTTQAVVEESIEELNTALGQAGARYADVEQQNAGLFGRR